METFVYVVLVALAILAFATCVACAREYVREVREDEERRVWAEGQIARYRQEDDDFEKEMAKIEERCEKALRRIRKKHERRLAELQQWQAYLELQFANEMAALLLPMTVDKTGKPI